MRESVADRAGAEKAQGAAGEGGGASPERAAASPPAEAARARAAPAHAESGPGPRTSAGHDASAGAPPRGRAAAFYDLDGTLVRGNVVSHYLFFALNDRSPSARAERLLGLVARAPLYAAQNRLDRRLFNETFYRSYEGLSEDRLHVLAAELFDRVLAPAIFPGAADLVRADRAAGRLTVLVTGALDVVAERAARHLGIERCYANRLRFAGQDRLCTGELTPPVLAGPGKVRFLRELAAREGIDLEASRAYADDAADVPFLSAVGHPVAVNPERSLRATATAHRWPILDLRGADEGGRRATFFDRALDGALSVLRMVEAVR